jgi:anti-sigma B factor antagonist
MHTPDRFELSTWREGDQAVLVIRGEIDLSSARELRAGLARLREGYQGTIIVDLSGVTFMDSTGMRVLLDAQERMLNEDRGLVLSAPVRNVLRALKIAQIDAVIPILERDHP